MLGDFELITHRFPDEITIYPVSDVHLGAMEHADAAWTNFIDRVKSEKAYLILAGDLLNNGVRTCKFVNPYEEVVRPREAKRMMVEYLSPLKDRILCVVTGNHERRTLKDDDQDITYDICAKLDIEHLYRENVAFMRVGIGTRSQNDNGRCEIGYTFAVTHGSGGGIYTGAAVNRSERYGNIIDGLDCLVTGHVHKGYISRPAKIVIDTRNGVVHMKDYVIISCVSWLNYGGYAAQKMLLPAHVAEPQKLRLLGKRDNKRIVTTW